MYAESENQGPEVSFGAKNGATILQKRYEKCSRHMSHITGIEPQSEPQSEPLNHAIVPAPCPSPPDLTHDQENETGDAL